jgi:hypothetical protein
LIISLYCSLLLRWIKVIYFVFYFNDWPCKVSYFIQMIVSLKKQPIIQLINGHIVDYPTPSNISYF